MLYIITTMLLLAYIPLAVPVFAFPFNIVVLLVIFSLRLRLKVDKPVMNDYGVFNPELALQTYQERYKRFSHLGIPQFAMPLNGLWTITQGNNGIHTHKLIGLMLGILKC